MQRMIRGHRDISDGFATRHDSRGKYRTAVSLERLTVMLSSPAADRREVTAMEEIAEDKWLTRQELADRYGLPVKTPAEWASKGTGPRYAKFGRHVRYRLSDVIDWEKDISTTTSASPRDERVNVRSGVVAVTNW